MSAKSRSFLGAALRVGAAVRYDAVLVRRKLLSNFEHSKKISLYPLS
jgi:hypothetical protein